jgi:hypothetical protein
MTAVDRIEIPIDLAEEFEAGISRAHCRCGFFPEGLRPNSPGPLEDFGEEKHRHVAPDAVALAGVPMYPLPRKITSLGF